MLKLTVKGFSHFLDKLYMKNIVLIIVLCLTGLSFSQRNFTLGDLKTPYSYRVNPAIMPESKFFIGIPVLGSFNFQLTNRISSINNLFVTNAQDSLVLNTSESFYDAMGDRTYVSLESTNQLLAFGFKVKKNYFTLDISNRFIAEVGFGKDFFKFLTQGNGASLLGQRASFDGIGASALSLIEYGIGYSREWNEKLNVGARVKLISGIANLSGTNTSFGISTDASNYNLVIDGAASIRSSNTLIYTDSAYMANNDPSRIASMAYNFSNFGLGFDFGGTYKLKEKITVSASVVDLGFINWKSGISNYKVNSFSYAFSGVDLNQLLSDSSDVGQEISDSLGSIFNLGNNSNPYMTGLPTKIYLGGSYTWNNYLSSGVTFYQQFFNSSYRPGLVISSTFSYKHWLGATLNYGIYAGSAANVGLGLRLRGFYILTDNLVSLINYQATKTASLAFGFSITVGKTHEEKASAKTE
jgi:hypothetical protein